ncbi:MAG: hypothetical protein AAGG48_31660 [Planctomycetota bacterium]
MNYSLPKFVLIFITLSGVTLGQDPARFTVQQSSAEVDMFDADSITKSKFFQTFKTDWKKTYGIELGMTVPELENLFAKQNAKTDNLPISELGRIFERGNHCVGREGSRESNRIRNGSGTLTYHVNGAPQFWLELAIKNDKVVSIHIAFGNGTWAATPVRIAGKGKYKSKIFIGIVESIETMNALQESTRDQMPGLSH